MHPNVFVISAPINNLRIFDIALTIPFPVHRREMIVDQRERVGNVPIQRFVKQKAKIV